MSSVAVRGQSSELLFAAILKQREGCGREGVMTKSSLERESLGTSFPVFYSLVMFLAVLESVCTLVNNSFLFLLDFVWWCLFQGRAKEDK